jgi:hypothetical protein
VPIWLLRRGRLMLARAAAVVPPVLSWSYYLAMPYTGGLGLLGLGTTVWFLGVCGSILGHEMVGAPGAARFHFRGRGRRSPASAMTPGPARTGSEPATSRLRTGMESSSGT